MADVIRAEGLSKRYGTVQALDGLDLAVPEGTVLGLLGPNGSGKTTAVSILTTLIEADEGTATVAGADVRTQPAKVRQRIGLSGQYAAVDEVLTGYENLEMIGRLYRMPKRQARERARALLDRFDLAEAADRPVKTYSGGMRRRLDLAGSIIAEPPVLFLDEPTTGLDPGSRLDMWDVIRERTEEGATILLTTQYLEEADALADRIVVIDKGSIIAEGTADELKAQVGGERIEVIVHDQAVVPQAREILNRGSDGQCVVDTHMRKLTVPTRSGSRGLVQVIRDLDEADVAIDDIALRRPTLDDVFLELTGHHAENNTDDAAPAQELASGRTT